MKMRKLTLLPSGKKSHKFNRGDEVITTVSNTWHSSEEDLGDAGILYPKGFVGKIKAIVEPIVPIRKNMYNIGHPEFFYFENELRLLKKSRIKRRTPMQWTYKRKATLKNKS